jgi:hypothetical protein
MIVSLAALMGVIGVLLVPAASQAAPAAPAASLSIAAPAAAVPAQIGFPFSFDLGALLRSILSSLPSFLQAALAPIFNALISQFCVFFGNCASG